MATRQRVRPAAPPTSPGHAATSGSPSHVCIFQAEIASKRPQTGGPVVVLIDIVTSGPAEVVPRVLVRQEFEDGLHPFGLLRECSWRKVGPVTKAGGRRR